MKDIEPSETEQSEAKVSAAYEDSDVANLGREQATASDKEQISLAEHNDLVNKLKAELDAAKAKAEENWDKFVRKDADLQNVQRRADIRVQKDKQFALESFAKELIVVVDTLEHGLSAFTDGALTENLQEGVSLTHKLFLDVLAKFDLIQISPAEDKFDPNLHEAISVQEVEGVDSNTVISTVQKGYVLNGRVIRPARVVVSK